MPTVTETLSKVPVVEVDQEPLETAKPTYTFCAMLMVWLVPICVQFTPSGDMYPLNTPLLRTALTQ